MASQAQTVTVTPNPASLSFTYQIGAALPTAQTVSVKASSGTPTFTVSTPGPDLWLTVTPSSGRLAASLSVKVNPTTLTARTYTSTITVTVTGVAAPLTIPVTLIVTPAPSLLVLNATTLNLTAPPNPAAQIVTLSTDGAVPVSYTATAGVAWLTVTTPTGGTSDIVFRGKDSTLTIAVDATALAPQTAPYVGKITLALTGATVKAQTITVNLTVSSSKPTIASIWPGTHPVNGPASTITLRGTNFYSASVVKVQGVATALATTYDKTDSTVLWAVVPASLLTASATLKVLVSNPAPGGDSATADLKVGDIPKINAVVNAASYSPGTVTPPDTGTVSPGELVTIFGSNIGPTTPASMTVTGGFVDTTLSNVSVTVDGKDAPMIYVSDSQVTIQVPYEVAVGAAKQVILTNGVQGPANTQVTIAAAAPGFFTADGSGVGQAAALNYNATTKQFSFNSGSNLAKIGDTVVLYLTGEGSYDVAPLMGGATDTGYVITTLPTPTPQLSPLPTVTIGGVDASAGVAYAGPMPGSITGLLQINVKIPVGSATGAAVPVAASISGVSTQSNITLAIHP